MKILFIGKFDPDYNRTKIIIDGLKHFKQAEVSFYNYTKDSKYNLFKISEACKKTDLIFLPSFTHLNVPLIRTISNKPLIFDPLISRYLTKVFDYKKVKRHSPRAYKNFLKDKISMRMADIVLCDTQAHKNYFLSTIGIPESKLKILPVGVNTEAFYPLPGNGNAEFTVGFYGSFIPLHGTRVIAEAAKLLQGEPVHFKLLGTGFEFEKVKDLAWNTYRLSNIDFTGWIRYSDLLQQIHTFDIALGIFGDTLKTDLVIPNKIYHYAAVKKAIITKDTPAIREIFENDKNILLCNNTPEDLAEKIILLKNNPALKERIAQAGYEKIIEAYNHKEIAGRFLEIATSLLNESR